MKSKSHDFCCDNKTKGTNALSTKHPNDTPTTVSRLTSRVPSAIAVLEINGPSAVDFAKRCWRPNRGDENLQIDAIRFGFTRCDVTRCDGLEQGESIVICRTGESRVEIHCHGGRMASDAILRKLVFCGAIEQPANLRRFVRSTDEIASEAQQDLLHATTLRTTAILLDQFRGSLGLELDTIKSMLIASNTTEAIRRLTQLNARAEPGRHLIEPWRVVLAGPPNSGKSSLLNMLLGYSRAIVHEQAGTTRDLLEERSSFDGWPIELVDGAGIRMATDAIETIGIEQTLQRIATADCTLLLVDQTTGWTQTHDQILAHSSGRVVLVNTKSDLNTVDANATDSLNSSIPDSITMRVDTSSVTGAGLKELMNTVVSILVPQPLLPGDPVPFRQRHRDRIRDLIAAVP